MTKLGVIISGGGSNLQAIIDATESGILKGSARVSIVISNKADAYGLVRARKHGIKAVHIDPKKYADNKEFCRKMLGELKENGVELVCLAGFMRMVDPCLVKEYKGRMLNIHPALLPKFGGKGMYGHHVHEAVIRARETESGATVHFVDEQYDNGPVILQHKVPVFNGDKPETLAARVLEAEHRIYPQAILKVIQDNK